MLNKFYKLPYWAYTVLFAILAFSAWPPSVFPFGIFFSFALLLFLEFRITGEASSGAGKKVFFYVYLSFLLWNIANTWWVWNASPGGGVTAIVANSLLMTLPVFLYHKMRIWVGEKLGLASLLVFWLGFEYLHLNWDISWPWLTLGNVFANSIYLVQWYEYTGVLGGTLWVLAVNYVVFQSLLIKWPKVISLILVSLVPVVWSFLVEIPKINEQVEVVVVQPNIDPYTEKFVGNPTHITYDDQLARLIELSKEQLTDSTAFLLWPETALQGSHYEKMLDYDPMIAQCRDFLKAYPNLTLLTGIESWTRFEEQEEKPITVKFQQNIGYYDTYNTAIAINEKGYTLYHKSKLVPGVETLPFPEVLGFVTKIINFAGAGNYGKQKERTVFWGKDSLGIAPLICYESIYGEFSGKYVNNGAAILGIITNDGWWGNTPGYKQHFHYAKLRAVEHRKAVARSANTGISGFINAEGKVMSYLDYETQGALRLGLEINKKPTFYAQHGDYIGRVAAALAVLLFVSAVVKRLRKNAVR